jgi:dephospho-CoA kinase
MKIAITGNIGGGKSTVLSLLRERLPAYAFGSVDDVVRGLYDDAAYQAALQGEFGVSDRAAVSNLVFADPAKKRTLERLADCFIKPAFARVLEQPDVIVEFPLLFESAAYYPLFDLRVTVSCSDATQAARILARDGVEGDKLAAIRASQMSNQTKRALADFVVDTDCSSEEVASRVDELVALVKSRAAAPDLCLVERELESRFMRRFQSARLWQIVRDAYSEPHRGYHVLQHPYWMFRLFDSLRKGDPVPLRERRTTPPVFFRPLAVELAIWFHDLVYRVDASYGLNELESARMMYRLLAEHCPWMLEIRDGFYADVCLAAEMIVSTQKHMITSPYILGNAQRESDTKLFLDIDLAILSESESTVDTFDANIRREFSIHSDEDFAKGRAAALGNFLRRERIYFSESFASREAAARANLQRLIDRYTQK